MSRHPIGDRAMTDAERQARHRAARAAGVPAIRIRRPADHRGRASAGTPASRRWWTLQANMPPGWRACRQTCRTVHRPKRCRRSSILTWARWSRSSRRAASDAISQRYDDARPSVPGLSRWVHREAGPARRSASLLRALRGAPGLPPCGLPGQASAAGAWAWVGRAQPDGPVGMGRDDARNGGTAVGQTHRTVR